MTKQAAALNDIIDTLLSHVEELGCTCATNEQQEMYHTKTNRRRRDSHCTGVALAVNADLRRRRANRLARRRSQGV